MNVEIWSLGKTNEDYIEQGMQYYFQKTKPWISVSLHILTVPKKDAQSDPQRSKILEEALILKKLQSHHYLILLDERGKMLNSIQWSQQMQQCMNMGIKTVVILIGGAFGVSENIKNKAQQCWSLSSLVFPHQLVRLVVAEQVYRAFSILNHSPYHHE
jgi:23S rRNA (pseudouridine1915-N3)-methyltransferase